MQSKNSKKLREIVNMKECDKCNSRTAAKTVTVRPVSKKYVVIKQCSPKRSGTDIIEQVNMRYNRLAKKW
ncbi:hypothetical protein D9O40_03590 [Clostridium autoethanogenum]|uniref:Uncharacterized protein n=1 Tax=Clostridium autoethanogenum TaxID=84023 RepID=A0A3M0SXV9_9CLOT|nr:hypothetical protein [Clostridium autoethanogenum]RMD03237.1 hypothetical protein D9O40_03590 [Clostridium autoethanogenum]